MTRHTLTLRQIESALKHYALHTLTGLFAIAGVFLRDRLIGLLVPASSVNLATAVVWLAIALVVMAGVSVIYFWKARKLEKVVLKDDPGFYEHQDYDDAFAEASKNYDDAVAEANKRT